GAVVAAGGGSSPGSAAQSQYKPPNPPGPPNGKPPCDQSRPDVPSVDKRFPGGRPPCPVPPQMEPLHLQGHGPFHIDSFFDVFTELPVGPPEERPPVPSVDKRFPPPVPSVDKRFPQGH